MKSRSKLILMMLITGLMLSACGIRPGDLAPPKGEDKDTFPHIYPKAPNEEIKNK